MLLAPVETNAELNPRSVCLDDYSKTGAALITDADKITRMENSFGQG